MTRALALVLTPVAAVLISAGSCAPVDPCAGVPRADAGLVQQADAREDLEIETEGANGAECVLVDGVWRDEASLPEEGDG